MVFLPRIHWPVYVVENDGSALFFLPFSLNFSLQTARLDIPLCGVDHAVLSGIWLHFEKQNICQTMKGKYRKIAIDRCEKMTKNHSKGVYGDSIFSLTSWLKKIGQYKVRCRIEWATKWEKKFLADHVWTSQKVKILVFAHGEKHGSPIVFRFFCIHLGYESRRQKCRFVAPVTSFRILSKSNGKSPRKVEKKVKNTFSSILTSFSAFFRCVFVVYSLFQELLGLKPWYFGISYRSLCPTFLRCQNPKTRTLMFWPSSMLSWTVS